MFALTFTALAVDLEHHDFTVTTRDGHTLSGRLSRPVGIDGPLPVVVAAPGSGPWTHERPIPLPDGGRFDYAELYAGLAAERGLAYVQIAKRGCTATSEPPFLTASREVFGTVTVDVLSSDLADGLRTVRTLPGIDPSRIALVGISEGTLTGPRAVLAAPDGVRGVALVGYVEDSPMEVSRWQHGVGAFRNIARRADLDRDGRVSHTEWEEVFPQQTGLWIARDLDGDGFLEPGEMARRNRRALRHLEKALARRDDDWLWRYRVQMNHRMWTEEAERVQNHGILLQLATNVAIFHGEHDGNVPVEGALAASMAFAERGRPLHLEVVPRGDHVLARPGETFDETGRLPPAWNDLFDVVSGWLQPDDG